MINNNYFNLKMLNDNLYQIMLNSNLNTLKQLCKTNHYAQNLCQNELFWQNKYHHDQFPQINITDWKYAYTKMFPIKHFLDKIFDLIGDNDTFPTKIRLRVKHMIQKLLPQKLNKFELELLRYFSSSFLKNIVKYQKSGYKPNDLYYVIVELYHFPLDGETSLSYYYSDKYNNCVLIHTEQLTLTDAKNIISTTIYDYNEEFYTISTDFIN